MSTTGKQLVPIARDELHMSLSRNNPEWALSITVAQAMNLRRYTSEQEDRWQYEYFRGDQMSIYFFHAWRSWRGEHSVLYVDWEHPESPFLYPLEFLDDWVIRTQDTRTPLVKFQERLKGFKFDPAPCPEYDDPEDFYPNVPAHIVQQARQITGKVEQDTTIPEEARTWAREIFPLYLMEKYGYNSDPWVSWRADRNKTLVLHESLISVAEEGYKQICTMLKL